MPKAIIFTDAQKAYAASAYEGGKSTRDLAKELGCSFQTIATMLKKQGITISVGRSLSAKLKGRVSSRKGAVLSEATKAKMRASMKGRKPTTLGKIYTPEQRANISAGRKRYFATVPKQDRKQRTYKKKLSDSERFAINKTRTLIKHLLRRTLLASGKRKCGRTEELLGYTRKELREHLEKQFEEGMSWENRSSFEIDHIVPVWYYVSGGVTDPKIINALSNLQVVEPGVNRFKSGMLICPF